MRYPGILAGRVFSGEAAISSDLIDQRLRDALLGKRPVYEAIDSLYGTDIGSSLDELVIKSCLDFFDEGQSVWRMPNRELGFFAAWRQVAMRNIRLSLRGLNISEILAVDDKPEAIIDYVMKSLRVPENIGSAIFPASSPISMGGRGLFVGGPMPKITIGRDVIPATWSTIWRYALPWPWPCWASAAVKSCLIPPTIFAN